MWADLKLNVRSDRKIQESHEGWYHCEAWRLQRVQGSGRIFQDKGVADYYIKFPLEEGRCTWILLLGRMLKGYFPLVFPWRITPRKEVSLTSSCGCIFFLEEVERWRFVEVTGFPRVAPYLTCGCFVICGVWQVAKRGLCMTQTGTPYYASPEVWRDMPYDARRSQLPAGASRPPNIHLER